MRLRHLIPIVSVALFCGCSSMYPKMLDDPEVRKAMVEMIRDSNKTWSADGSIHNPEVEFYYKMSVGGRVVGVDGDLHAAGAAGPQE